MKYAMMPIGLAKARQVARTGSQIRLDLGCGSQARPGTIGIDLSWHTDIPWDIRWGIPFPDESIESIVSDHFFEHLELTVVMSVLRECKRVLRPGRPLVLTVPHIDPYLDAYLRRDIDFLTQHITDIPSGQEDIYTTCFDRIAWLLLRSGEHRSLFDRESILAKVRQAGFNDVSSREYDPSQDINYRFSSVYVVAQK